MSFITGNSKQTQELSALMSAISKHLEFTSHDMDAVIDEFDKRDRKFQSEIQDQEKIISNSSLSFMQRLRSVFGIATGNEEYDQAVGVLKNLYARQDRLYQVKSKVNFLKECRYWIVNSPDQRQTVPCQKSGQHSLTKGGCRSGTGVVVNNAQSKRLS